MIASFLSLLFPETCAMCQGTLVQGEAEVCTHCHHKLAKTNDHLDPKNLLSQRFWGKVKIKHTMAYLKFIKNGSTQRLLHSIKYGNRKEAANVIGQWYGADLSTAGHTFDVIVPVPLHKKKLLKRGYNQSTCFAEGLTKALGSPCSEALIRLHEKESQTNKGRFERWENVDGIFVLAPKANVLNKKVLLVDDVITTGATLEACAKALIDGGAQEISIAAIASAQ